MTPSTTRRWNLSDTPRAILIFDVWNPLLSAAEREMIATATEIYAKFYSLPARRRCEQGAPARHSRPPPRSRRGAGSSAENVSAGLAECLSIAGAEARAPVTTRWRSAPGALWPPMSGRRPHSRAPHPQRTRHPAAARPLRPRGRGRRRDRRCRSRSRSHPAPAAAQDPAEAAKNFGLSSAQLHSAPQGPPSIEARVAQVGVDRALRSYAVLDNGQSWLSTDGGMELVSGEQVSIKRAALGSFMLVSSTSKHSYHVRRLH